MRSPFLLWLFTIVIFLLACLASFFLVLNSVFSDGPFSERLVVFGIIALVYGGLAGLCGALFPKKIWWWMGWLCGPAVTILVLYTLAEPFGLPLHLLALASVILPAYVCLRLTNRHH